jgi:hypothetical protein
MDLVAPVVIRKCIDRLADIARNVPIKPEVVDADAEIGGRDPLREIENPGEDRPEHEEGKM